MPGFLGKHVREGSRQQTAKLHRDFPRSAYLRLLTVSTRNWKYKGDWGCFYCLRNTEKTEGYQSFQAKD